ncbi:MAG: amino acid adenylation domain-containing protein, partial [Clostridiaceae bacterium]|nr:amino acid adenylation domain-containing protein [Clostridiaceae bacterium]
IIYTSGTTGKPKGVMIEHRNVVRLMFNDKFQFDFNDRDVWTMFHSFCFDFSVWEMYGALLYGGRLVIVPEMVSRETSEFLKLLKEEKVTVLNQTPSAFYNLIKEEIKYEGNDNSVRYVIFGGEALKPAMLKPWRQKYPQTRLINMYGITETTVHVTYKEITDLEISLNISNIGKPIPTLTCYIMDRNMRLLPVGVPGELCVGGDGVGRGYLNREELTNEKFIDNPYLKDERLYRSGDLAKLLPNGEMEYLGRIDHQVKIRGFRIELGEIESKLIDHSEIKESVVLAQEGQDGDKYLCAYYVAQRELTVKEIREHLLKDLPEYMVPSFFIRLDSIPLTTNGKVNRRALPKPQESINTGAEYEAPSTAMETELVKIWERVLGISRVGINDNFFELGGHSLKATRLIAEIHKELNVDIPLREMFRNPTVKGLAQFAEASSKDIFTSIKPVEKREFYPLSSAQKRLYVIDRMSEEGDTSYNMPMVVRLEGDVDVDRLNNAFKSLARRHESLRTYFELIDGQAVQKICEDIDFEIDFVEASEEETGLIVDRFVRPFDLSKPGLIRVCLIKSNEGSYVLMMDIHHIICDGSSIDILLKELISLYNGQELMPLAIQYRDYSVWQNNMLEEGIYKKQEEYWLEAFKGEIPVLDIPADFARPPVKSFEGEVFSFGVEDEIRQKLAQIASDNGATLFMVLLGAFNVLLSRYSGQEDIVIGSPIAGRRHADLQNVVGMFVNTLAFRNYPEKNRTFNEFVKEVRENALKVFENQDYQFEELVEKLKLKKDMSRNPLFDVMFVMQNYENTDDGSDGNSGDFEVSPYGYDLTISKFDLTLNASETEDGIRLSIEYCTKLYCEETIKRISRHFTNLLKSICEDPQSSIIELNMTEEDEKSALLYDFNNTRSMDIDPEIPIHRLFEDIAGKYPSNTAVIAGSRSISYKELNESANRLARALIKTYEQEGCAGKNPVVAIMADRSIEMVTGILAVMKSGGAYVPVDSAYPEERKRYMLEDSGAKVLLAKEGISQESRMNFGGRVVMLEDSFDSFDAHNISKADPCDLAYIIYTSGTTGKPKGVMVRHRNITNSIQWRRDEYCLNSSDTVLQLFSHSFDGFLTSFFTPVVSGSRVVLPDEDEAKDPVAIKDYIARYNISHFICVPSLYSAILECISPQEAKSLKMVTLAGEKVGKNLIEKCKSINPDIELINEYGPTESSVVATIMRDITTDKYITIGKPISNTRIYIMSDGLKLCPIGVPGELCIAGNGLARGYLGREDLTSEKFVENPYKLGERIYRTGDLARMLPDGSIDFIGRVDEQVKIRGFRIELEEIESQLRKHPEVKEAVVAVKDDGRGNKMLCACLISENMPAAPEIRSFLSKELPDYMIPSYFMSIESIPLSPNGKVDRKALPDPDGNIYTGVEFVAPRNNIENKLATVWKEILKLERVGVLDDFFNLGGDSLKATILNARIHKEFDVSIPLREIFQNPTIEKLAKVIESSSKSIYATIKPVPKMDYYPLSSAQKRIYVVEQYQETGTSYNIAEQIFIEGKLDFNRLEYAFKALIMRHETLRTSFVMVGGKPVQVIHDDVPFKLDYADLKDYEQIVGDVGDISREDKEERIIDYIIDEFVRPFNLEEAPLIRAKLLKLREDLHVLLYDIHHIVFDGTSMGILSSEFIDLYEGRVLEPLNVQYKDFSIWQNKLFESEAIKKQEEYWLNVFSKEKGIPELNLPSDFKRPEIQSFEGSTNVSFVIDRETSLKLKSFTAQTGATLYMTMLAAFNIFLSKLSGQQDIVVGCAVAGRPHSDLQNIIGMFVNVLAMRNYPNKDMKFIEFLDKVTQNTLDAFENQDYQFEKLVEILDQGKDSSRPPLFNVSFALQNMDIDTREFEDIRIMPYGKPTVTTSKYDFTLYSYEDKDEEVIYCYFEYCIKLFTKETMERFAKYFLRVINTITDNPDIELSNIEILDEEERNKLLTEISGTENIINELDSEDFADIF